MQARQPAGERLSTVKRDCREGQLMLGMMSFEIDPRTFQATLDQTSCTVAEAEASSTGISHQLCASIGVNRGCSTLAAAQQRVLKLSITTHFRNQSAASSYEPKAAQAEYQRLRKPCAWKQGAAERQVARVPESWSVRLHRRGSQALNPGQSDSSAVLRLQYLVDPIRRVLSITERVSGAHFAVARQAASSAPVACGRCRPLQLTLSNDAVYPHREVGYRSKWCQSRRARSDCGRDFEDQRAMLTARTVRRNRVGTSSSTTPKCCTKFWRTPAALGSRADYQVAVVDANNRVAIAGVDVGDRVGPMWIVPRRPQAGRACGFRRTSKVKDGTQVNPIPDKTAGAK